MSLDGSPLVTAKPLAEKIKEAGSHTLIYGLGAAFQTLLGFILIPLYTRYYTAETYGVLSLLVLCGTLAGVVFYLGASSALSRSYYDYHDGTERKRVISTSLFLTLSGALLQVLLGFLLRERLSLLLFGTTKYALHINIVLVSSALSFTNNLFYLLLRFERKSKQVIILNLVTLTTGASLILFFLTVLKVGVMAPILGEAINQSFAFGLLFYLTRKSYVLDYSVAELKLQLQYGIPTVLAGLAFYLLTCTDRLVINKYCSLSDVGIYSLGYKIGMVVNTLFVLPFGQIWAPMRMEYRHDLNAGILYKVMLTYYFLIGLLFTAGVSLFSKEILSLLSGRREYIVAYKIVPIIMSAHLIYGAVNILDVGVAFSRKVMYNVYTFSSAVVLNVGLNWALVPRFGYQAAAFVILATFVVLVSLVFLVSKRLYPIKVEGRRLCAIFGSGLLIVYLGYAVDIHALWLAATYKLLLLAGLVAAWCRLVVNQKERVAVAAILRGLRLPAVLGGTRPGTA